MGCSRCPEQCHLPKPKHVSEPGTGSLFPWWVGLPGAHPHFLYPQLSVNWSGGRCRAAWVPHLCPSRFSAPPALHLSQSPKDGVGFPSGRLFQARGTGQEDIVVFLKERQWQCPWVQHVRGDGSHVCLHGFMVLLHRQSSKCKPLVPLTWA